MNIFEKVKGIVAEQLGVETDEITLETSFDDLNADSLDVVELIILEEEFDIEIPDEDAEKIKTVGDAVIILKKKKNVRSGWSTDRPPPENRVCPGLAICDGGETHSGTTRVKNKESKTNNPYCTRRNGRTHLDSPAGCSCCRRRWSRLNCCQRHER